MVCPITNINKGIPIQIKLDYRTNTTGVIMADQAKILDLDRRNDEFVDTAPRDIVVEVIDIISGFIEIED